MWFLDVPKVISRKRVLPAPWFSSFVLPAYDVWWRMMTYHREPGFKVVFNPGIAPRWAKNTMKKKHDSFLFGNRCAINFISVRFHSTNQRKSPRRDRPKKVSWLAQKADCARNGNEKWLEMKWLHFHPIPPSVQRLELKRSRSTFGCDRKIDSCQFHFALVVTFTCNLCRVCTDQSPRELLDRCQGWTRPKARFVISSNFHHSLIGTKIT
jgi:hypothetical protein